MISGHFPCNLLSFDRCAERNDADVWPALAKKEAKIETIVAAKHSGLHSTPLNSGFQALQGFSLAKGDQRWGTTWVLRDNRAGI